MCSLDLVVKVGLHLEHLPELLIASREKKVRHRIAGHNELDVNRDRLRPQRLRGEQTVLLARVFQAHFAGPDKPFQPVPGARLRHHIHEVQDQVPAVRLVHRARPQERMVAKVRTESRPPLDAPEEVRPVGVRLDDDRRASDTRVVDEGVDTERQQRVRPAD